MKRWLSYLAAMAVFAMCGLGSAAGQKEPRPGTVIVPPSNAEAPQDIGRHAHTNFLIFVPASRGGKKPGPAPNSVPSGETPSSLSCVYQTWAGQISGCPINNSGYGEPSGGTNAIAIVDAYDYPTADSDFQTFSEQFNLPYGDKCGASHNEACFTKVYAAGGKPRSNCGWAQEAALDIEWSHAMAPYARIFLVEAASNSISSLMDAVQVASNWVASAGGGQVSMSWGSSEFSTQATYDSYFTGSGVTYFASSGDSGGKVIWPSTSPNVISAGGTTVNRDSDGDFSGESAWSSAGGGPSKYEPVPDYQSAIYSLAQLLNGRRGTPDFSFDSNPSTGVSVYDSTPCQGLSGWMVFGGTSVAAPSLAGIVNLSGDFSGDNAVQANIYQNYSDASSGGNRCNYTSPFYDVTSGSAGSYHATGCWDFASGVGSDRGLSGPAAALGFSLSASPSSASVTQGQNTSFTITVAPSGGYTGTVNLSVPDCPGHTTCSLSPDSVNITSGPQSVSLNVTTTSSTSAGSYTLTVTGTDSGLTSSTSVSLTVTSAPSGGSFTLGASSGTISVARGSRATDTITVTPSGGFTGSVNLSVSGLPKFTSGSFSPNPVSVSGSASSSTLTVTANKHAARGTYSLTVTGTSGSLSESTVVALSVQ